MKYLRAGLPVLVVFAIVFNAVAAYGSDNMPAVHANITALCGWLVIAVDEFYNFYNLYVRKDAQNVSDTIA